MSQLRFLHIYMPVLALLWIGMYLDSSRVAAYFPQSQWVTNMLFVMLFFWLYQHVSVPVRKMMLYGLPLALLGELFFSVVLGMYTYRLNSVPLYVPFGHCMVYVAVCYMVKEPLFRRYLHRIDRSLYLLMVIYSTLWLLLADDLFGFLCLLVILWIFYRHPITRPYFLVMYVVVVYVELLGTHYHCWQWPPIWFGLFDWVPSANPPSAISVVYFGFDTYCLWSYRQLNRDRWRRMRSIQRIRLAR